MRTRIAAIAVAAWAIGLLIGLSMSNWYEYRFVRPGSELTTAVNNDGWQLVPGVPESGYVRRPRLRIP